ncbi:hypothetical protein PE36_08086 [Moritella sp. PE36]|uniref:hypothetical protein n=1 Tax=Moritella sp. PE36 TaxID=58051 RepID=UPI0001568DBD|nr:hypothetical protein [Moritella sp. PE36]EDM65945.1 hypothetical protein PE36_08086 [Moritella sp. PE36]
MKKEKLNLTIIIVVCVTSFVALGACLINKFAPKEKTAAGFAPLSAQYAKACSNDGLCLEKVVLLQGQFVLESENVLKAFVAENSVNGDIEYFCFDSPGGDNDFGKFLGNYISKNKLSTCVADKYFSLDTGKEIETIQSETQCVSMCPYTYMAGNERVMLGKTASFLYHSSSDKFSACGVCLWSSKNESEAEEFNKLLNTYIENGSLPVNEIEVMITKTFKIPPETTKRMSIEQLKHYNVVTEFK